MIICRSIFIATYNIISFFFRAEREPEALRKVFQGRFGQKCREGSAARGEGLRRRAGTISRSWVSGFLPWAPGIGAS